MCANGNRRGKTMDEERMAILRMVAEGKITADEAAQLLDALRESQRRSEYADDRPHGERHGRRPEDRFDWQEKFASKFAAFSAKAADRAFAVVDDLFQHWEDQTIDLPEGSNVTISCTAGNLTVRGTDSGQMRVSANGGAFGPRMLAPRIQVDREAKRVAITSTTHNLTVELPWQAVAVQAQGVGGNMTLSDLSASLALHVAGGHLHVTNVTGAIAAKAVGGQADLTDIRSSSLDVTVMGGSVSVTIGTITEGTVDLNTVGGNITLRLPTASAFDVDAEAKHGSIRTNLPIVVESKHFGERLKGTYHGGGATIRLYAKAGHVELEGIEESATEPTPEAR